MQRTFYHHVAVLELLEARQAQLIHQMIQLALVARPEPGRPEVEAIGDFPRAAGHRAWSPGRHGYDAPTERLARLKQHVIPDTTLLQQVCGVQTAQAAADDDYARCRQHRTVPIVPLRWPVLR